MNNHTKQNKATVVLTLMIYARSPIQHPWHFFSVKRFQKQGVSELPQGTYHLCFWWIVIRNSKLEKERSWT